MKKRILIVNNDIAEASELQARLSNSCTEVILATTIEEALQHFIKTEFCLVIFDANMSVDYNHQLIKAIRKLKAPPVLVLSSQATHSDRLQAFQGGAHAYIGKPFPMEECLAQAESLMQLYMNLNPESNICYTLAFGKDLVIDPETRQAFLKGKDIPLTRKEFDILFCLASNPGRVFTREQLYDQVWDETSAFNVDDVVKTHIKTLRQKLSDSDLEYIKNVWGVGYRFHHEGEE